MDAGMVRGYIGPWAADGREELGKFSWCSSQGPSQTPWKTLNKAKASLIGRHLKQFLAMLNSLEAQPLSHTGLHPQPG